jgi:chemotaxis family two-component system response regulator Rcp1
VSTPAVARFDILLVEDEPAGARLIRETLRASAARVRVAVVGDGLEALRYLRREGLYAGVPRPDLIILDLNMPRMSGRELLAEVKSDPDLRRIPVVVLTTSEAEDDVRTSYDLHANCYVAKPADLGQFAKTMQRLQEFWFSVVRLPPF